jgi:diguanylate cyclase (GGDEF)-like protein
MPDRLELKKPWGLGMHFVPVLAVACLGLITAVAVWFTVSAWEERLAKQAFNDVAGDYATVLQHGLDQYLDKLRAMRAFYDSSIKVDPDEFSRFSDQILAGYGGMMRLIWCPRVTRDERVEFERKARKTGLGDFAIRAWAASGPMTPSPQRDEYFPILYSTASAEFRRATFGTDLNSEAVRSEAIARARDNNIMATAQNIWLRNPIAKSRSGFLAFLPVYKTGTSNDNVDERRRNTLGMVVGVFQIDALFNAILDQKVLPHDVSLYVYAANRGDDTSPIYVREADHERGPTALNSKAANPDAPSWTAPIRVGDVTWKLTVVPIQQGIIGFYRAWMAAIGVILLFGALLAYLWASLRYARRLEKANDQVMQLAATDLLTNLANRRAFIKQLTLAYAEAKRGAPPFAVLYLDIDEFKDVNDTLGHPMGDLLIKGMVDRLKSAVRQSDFVSRFGGDEFAILQSNVTDASAAGALATKIGNALAAPFLIDGHEINITSSIGISVFTPDLAGPDTMMVQADLALYRAKADGRNRFCFHTADLDQQVRERVRVTEELRSAIENGELELHYQPQVEIATGRIIGVEALVRWNHKTRGLIGPGQFIAIAERTGVIVPLGHWILEEACRQLRLWQAEGIAPLVVAVNVSGVQLKAPSEFGRDVEETLKRWNIDPAEIELELTESVLMDATQRQNEALFALQRMGTKIAIDDFGTGYSSLKYLTIYPVSRLKLAQEFVFRVTVDYRNAAVVRAAIRLANELGIEVIAEGVETEAQKRFLMAAGCRQAQGYYFSRPVPAARATELLRRGVIGDDSVAAAASKSSAA